MEKPKQSPANLFHFRQLTDAEFRAVLAHLKLNIPEEQIPILLKLWNTYTLDPEFEKTLLKDGNPPADIISKSGKVEWPKDWPDMGPILVKALTEGIPGTGIAPPPGGGRPGLVRPIPMYPASKTVTVVTKKGKVSTAAKGSKETPKTTPAPAKPSPSKGAAKKSTTSEKSTAPAQPTPPGTPQNRRNGPVIIDPKSHKKFDPAVLAAAAAAATASTGRSRARGGGARPRENYEDQLERLLSMGTVAVEAQKAMSRPGAPAQYKLTKTKTSDGGIDFCLKVTRPGKSETNPDSTTSATSESAPPPPTAPPKATHVIAAAGPNGMMTLELDLEEPGGAGIPGTASKDKIPSIQEAIDAAMFGGNCKSPKKKTDKKCSSKAKANNSTAAETKSTESDAEAEPSSPPAKKANRGRGFTIDPETFTDDIEWLTSNPREVTASSKLTYQLLVCGQLKTQPELGDHLTVTYVPPEEILDILSNPIPEGGDPVITLHRVNCEPFNNLLHRLLASPHLTELVQTEFYHEYFQEIALRLRRHMTELGYGDKDGGPVRLVVAYEE